MQRRLRESVHDVALRRADKQLETGCPACHGVAVGANQHSADGVIVPMGARSDWR
jgi:hypothetical protein